MSTTTMGEERNKRCGKISHRVFVAFINIDDNALIKYRLGVEIHRPRLVGNGVQIISKKIFTGNSPFSLTEREPIASIDQNKNAAFCENARRFLVAGRPTDRRPGSNFPENAQIFPRRFVSARYGLPYKYISGVCRKCVVDNSTNMIECKAYTCFYISVLGFVNSGREGG